MYTNQPGVTLKAIGAGTTTCSTTLVLLDDTASCLKFADENGVVYDTNCTPDIASSNEMYAYASAGYILNRNGKFIIFDMYTGTHFLITFFFHLFVHLFCHLFI